MGKLIDITHRLPKQVKDTQDEERKKRVQDALHKIYARVAAAHVAHTGVLPPTGK